MCAKCPYSAHNTSNSISQEHQFRYFFSLSCFPLSFYRAFWLIQEKSFSFSLWLRIINGKNTTIKVNLIFTFPRKKQEDSWWIKILINNFFFGVRLKSNWSGISTEQDKNRSCFLYATTKRILEDELSAHSSCRWLARSHSVSALSSAVMPKHPSMDHDEKSYKYITEKFMYHILWAYRNPSKITETKEIAVREYFHFFFNINHLIVFFSGRSNRPVEIINVFVICEQFGVSIFSVFLSPLRLQSDKHVSLRINFFRVSLSSGRVATQQKCILDHFNGDTLQSLSYERTQTTSRCTTAP